LTKTRNISTKTTNHKEG
jgi:hypothetical protein